MRVQSRRLINADLVGSQSTAALQHQNDLADICGQVVRCELAWSITVSPGAGSVLVVALFQSRTAASAGRPHDVSPTHELPAAVGVPRSSSGRQERSTRTVHWLVPAVTDISIFSMTRQSIDPRSCSTTPLRDLTWPRATISAKRSASRSKSSAVINRACQIAGLPARSANSRYQPASSRRPLRAITCIPWRNDQGSLDCDRKTRPHHRGRLVLRRGQATLCRAAGCLQDDRATRRHDEGHAAARRAFEPAHRSS